MKRDDTELAAIARKLREVSDLAETGLHAMDDRQALLTQRDTYKRQRDALAALVRSLAGPVCSAHPECGCLYCQTRVALAEIEKEER